MFVRKLIISLVWNVTVFGLILFPIAGTFHWWRAWVFIGLSFVATIVNMVGVLRTRPELLNERMKGLVQRGQPVVDRVIVLTFLVAFLASMLMIPCDVFYWHLLPRPPVWVSSLGMVLFVVGWTLVALSFRDNAFAVPVVRLQTERQHAVADTGVYSILRHPLYAGVMLLNVGMPLWLESYAAAIFAVVPSGLLVVRILFEEKFLRRELAGYEEYTRRVRTRLVPFVW